MVRVYPKRVVSIFQIDRRHPATWGHHPNDVLNGLHLKMNFVNLFVELLQVQNKTVGAISFFPKKHGGEKI